jgi:hypothetical protein
MSESALGYTDYLFKTPSLPTATGALAALVAAGVLAAGEVPQNMLGDPQTVTVASVTVTIRARQGWAASSYTDPDSGQVVTVAAAGDPTQWYLSIRSYVPPGAQPVDPTAYGLVASDPAESASVLGVWA